MRYGFALVVVILMKSCATAALADDDAELKRLLSFLGTAHLGDNYEVIKKLAPDIGPLQKDAGDDNTEAFVKTQIGKVAFRGEFNFAKGRLVSHGFETGEMTHAEAHDLLLRCVPILEDLYGDSTRRIELPTESDGPADSIGMSFNWHKEGAEFGLDFHYRREFATISWGAQAE
jgi:hypothetical protein